MSTGQMSIQALGGHRHCKRSIELPFFFMTNGKSALINLSNSVKELLSGYMHITA